MIPLADDNPTQTRPYIVYVLIALNVMAYLIDISGPTRHYGGRLWNYSMIPYSVIHNRPVELSVPVQVVLPNGMRAVAQMRDVHWGLNPQWLTIFTSMFRSRTMSRITSHC